MSVAKTILKRLFRVYAHIYHQHFDSVMQLQEEAHLNTSFKHFIFFVQVKHDMKRCCRLATCSLESTASTAVIPIYSLFIQPSHECFRLTQMLFLNVWEVQQLQSSHKSSAHTQLPWSSTFILSVECGKNNNNFWRTTI